MKPKRISVRFNLDCDDDRKAWEILHRLDAKSINREIIMRIKNLVKKYNKQHKEPLPNITPHSFRHTFCTRMANAGMNPKALQYIMGHANITMTLDYYTHVDACSVKAEMERLAA